MMGDEGGVSPGTWIAVVVLAAAIGTVVAALLLLVAGYSITAVIG
jgi:hypothetical protein